MTDTLTLDGILAEHVAAVNAFDEDAIVATFADDALVNDATVSSGVPRRSAAGSGRKWSATM